MTAAQVRDDVALFALMRNEPFSAVIGGVMDKMGLTKQFLPPYLGVLDSDMVIAGRPVTVLEADYFAESVIDWSSP